MPFRTLIFCVFGGLLFPLAVSSQAAKADLQAWREQATSMMGSNPDSSLVLANLIYVNSSSQADQDYARYLAGQFFYKKGEYDTAYFLLDAVVESLGESEAQGMAYSTIGRIFSRQDNFAYAEKFHHQALAVFENLQIPLRKFFTLNDLGIVHYSTGNYTRALEYYLKAMDLAYDAQFENRLVRLMSNIVGVYTMLNQDEKALELAREAVRLSQKTADPVDQKTALTALAYAHKELGNIDSAVYFNEKALEWLQKSNNFFSLSWQLMDIGDLQVLKKDYSAALKAYQGALAYLQDNDIQEDLDVMLLQVAEVFLMMNKPDSALAYALEVNRFSEANHLKWSMQKSAEMLAKIYADKNQLQRATAYYTQALAYKDSIYNDKNQQQFTDQRIKLETLEKVKEIELLKREAQIAELRRVATRRNSLFGILALTLVLIGVVAYYLQRQKIHRLKAEELQRELDRNQRDLSVQTMRMIRMTNHVTELEENLKGLKQKYNGDAREVQQSLSKIRLDKSLEKEWESFNQFFLNAHPQFIDKLRQHHPDLTVSEIRLSTLMKLNLTSAEIASLMNIEPKSVRMSKYRLKKRMGIGEEVDITAYLQTL